MSREWKKVRKFVLFFFFLYNIKSYIFGDLNYVKNPAGDQCSAFLWGVYD